MKLDSDDFELLGVPRRFAQDRATLDANWRQMQAKVHPDRFVAELAPARRFAMQWSVRVNEAYQRLKDPLKRAALLCEMHGAPIEAENNTAMPPAFLVQQMEWRESLDDARDAPAIRALQTDVEAHRAQVLDTLRRLIDEAGDYPAAVRQVRALMFIERFADDVGRRLDALED